MAAGILMMGGAYYNLNIHFGNGIKFITKICIYRLFKDFLQLHEDLIKFKPDELRSKLSEATTTVQEVKDKLDLLQASLASKV